MWNLGQNTYFYCKEYTDFHSQEKKKVNKQHKPLVREV